MGGVVDAITDVVDSVVDTVGDVVEDVVDVVEDVVDGVGDFVGDIGETAVDALSSPIGQIAVSVAFPAYAPYINAAAKVANGQDLSLYDVASLGLQGYSDLQAGVKVDPKIVKATKAAARIADGADPKTVLIGAYGADFIKETGLADSVKDTISSTIGDDAYQFVDQYMDVEQAGIDLLAGEQPLRMLANQFGDEAANYLGSDDPNMKAFGYGAITTAVGLDEGLSPEKALLRGIREYSDKGGESPDLGIGNISSSIGLDLNDLKAPEFLSDAWNWAKDNAPDIDLDFGNIDLSGYSFNDFGFDTPELLDMNLDLSGVDFSNFNLGDLNGINIQDLEGRGADLSKFKGTALAFGIAEDQAKRQAAQEDEEEDIFKISSGLRNDLLADEELPLSRKLLARTV